MSRVGLGAAWRQGSEQGLEAEFEIAHGHDAVDGALAKLGGQGEDFGGDPAQVAVLLFQAVQLLAACIARNVIPGVNPPVYCVQDSRYGPTIPANSVCTH